MLKIDYKNPMMEVFQYEYALYMLVSDLFAGVCCRSLVVQNLRLYYMDLVKVSKKNGIPSYEEQYRMEKEVQAFIERDVLDKIVFPGMHMCRAELTIRTRKDGSHSFIFQDGVYGFAIHLEMGVKGKPKGIAVRQIYSEKSDTPRSLGQGSAYDSGRTSDQSSTQSSGQGPDQKPAQKSDRKASQKSKKARVSLKIVA